MGRTTAGIAPGDDYTMHMANISAQNTHNSTSTNTAVSLDMELFRQRPI